MAPGRPSKRKRFDNLESKKSTVSEFDLQNVTIENVQNVDYVKLGNFCQFDARFSEISRGNQCTAISCVAIVHDQYKSVFEWNSANFENILTVGDNLYIVSKKMFLNSPIHLLFDEVFV